MKPRRALRHVLSHARTLQDDMRAMVEFLLWVLSRIPAPDDGERSDFVAVWGKGRVYAHAEQYLMNLCWAHMQRGIQAELEAVARRLPHGIPAEGGSAVLLLHYMAFESPDSSERPCYLMPTDFLLLRSVDERLLFSLAARLAILPMLPTITGLEARALCDALIDLLVDWAATEPQERERLWWERLRALTSPQPPHLRRLWVLLAAGQIAVARHPASDLDEDVWKALWSFPDGKVPLTREPPQRLFATWRDGTAPSELLVPIVFYRPYDEDRECGRVAWVSRSRRAETFHIMLDGGGCICGAPFCLARARALAEPERRARIDLEERRRERAHVLFRQEREREELMRAAFLAELKLRIAQLRAREEP